MHQRKHKQQLEGEDDSLTTYDLLTLDQLYSLFKFCKFAVIFLSLSAVHEQILPSFYHLKGKYVKSVEKLFNLRR